MTGWLPWTALALAGSLAATWPLRRVARRFAILDRPGGHKSHREPVPYLGGLAVLCGAGLSLLAHHHRFTGLLALVCLVTALGLYDDIRHASVATKLTGEMAVAVAAMGLGFVWQITDSSWLNWAISLVWIVGITNSFNLLDNMDGLASAVGATALLAVALILPHVSPLAPAVGGALLGFLVINRPPARMYLGDAGSLAVGFVAALVTISAANTAHGVHSLLLLACPVALAIFDTSLVIVSRLLTGRPVQLGGRDHFSHRLLMIGWSKRAILVGATVATAGAALIAYLAGQYPLAEAWLALPLVVAYGGAWWRLLRLDPYRAGINSRPEVMHA